MTIEILSARTLADIKRRWELETVCRRQQATIERLELRILRLEEQLRRSSRNSSQPPSMDGPSVARPNGRPIRHRRRPSNRKGHAGRTRDFAPPERVDAVVECRPACCAACASPLAGSDPTPLRHQVSEIPVPQVTITEYRRHRLSCAHCGHVSLGALPAGVSQSAFGPRLHALTALLTGGFLLSKRDAVSLFDVVYGLRLSPSSVGAMERRMAAALAGAVAEARDWVRSAPVVHPDETGWRQAKQRAWLWTAATDEVVVFNIHRRRSQDAAKELLGPNFAGAVCTDRYGAYNWVERRGYCWAHLQRDFQAMAERRGSAWYGQRLVASAKRVMLTWRHERDGQIDRRERDDRLADERRRVHRLLVAARERAPALQTRRECAELLKTEERLWTFLSVEGMPPTNNLAERCLRRAVIWRKKSFGTDSERGSRFVERILSAVTTLQLQRRDIFGFLVHARHVAVAGGTPMSLVPNP